MLRQPSWAQHLLQEVASSAVGALPPWTMDANTLESHLNRQLERSKGFFWNRLRWDLVASQLPAEGPLELVDVGAGPGFLGDFLAVHRPNIAYRFVEPITGLENDLEARFGEASNLRDSSSFGATQFVTLLDVLEHQEDDVAFLRELSEKMAPTSTLLLTVPAMPSLWSAWDVLLGHYRRYTKAMLASRVSSLPFEVEEIDYIFPELLPLGWIRKLKRGASGAEEGGSGSTEFPDLPEWLNSSLYRVGTHSLALRRSWPAGTSVFAILRRSA